MKKQSQSSLSLIVKIVVLVVLMVSAVGLIMNFVGDINDTIDGFGGGGNGSTITTSTTGTTIAPSDCENHEYKNGVCVKCATVCAHSEQAVLENGNTYCTECGKLYALKTPLISVNAAQISWDAIPDATEYIVNVNSAKYKTENTFYKFVSDQAGEFAVTVQAVSGSVISEKSNIYTFVYYNVLSNPNDQGLIVTPSNVVRKGASCSGTVVPKSGHLIPDQIYITMGGVALSGYTYDHTTGEFMIENVTGDIYITYDAPSGVPSAPVLTLSGSVVSWDPVPGATDYHIRVLGKDTVDLFDKYYETMATSFDLANVDLTEEASYYVSVWCDSPYGFGDASAVIYVYSISKLEAPALTLNGSLLSWNAVAGAQWYTIYVEGTDKTGTFRMTEDCSFNLSTYVDDLVEFGGGSYHIWIKASGIGYADSSASNKVAYVVGPLDAKLVAPEIELI